MDDELNNDELLKAIEDGSKPEKRRRKVDLEVEQLKAELKEGISKLKEKISTADTLNERLRATYELQEELNRLESKPTPGLNIIGSFNEPDILDTVAKQHMKPGNFYHWSNSHPNIYDVRRGRGFKPVLDENGERVIMGDAVLMTMSEKQHREEIVIPKQRRKSAVRNAIVNDFKDAGKENGVKVFGRIQYDDGEVVHAGEDDE